MYSYISHQTHSVLSFSSAGNGQFLTGIFKGTYIVSVKLKEVAGGNYYKNCCLRW